MAWYLKDKLDDININIVWNEYQTPYKIENYLIKFHIIFEHSEKCNDISYYIIIFDLFVVKEACINFLASYRIRRDTMSQTL